jgi:hypothetical protein
MSTSSKVLKTNIKKEKGTLYFLTPHNEIKALKIDIDGPSNDKAKTIMEVKFKRQSGYMYFIDRDGDISRVKAIV